MLMHLAASARQACASPGSLRNAASALQKRSLDVVHVPEQRLVPGHAARRSPLGMNMSSLRPITTPAIDRAGAGEILRVTVDHEVGPLGRICRVAAAATRNGVPTVASSITRRPVAVRSRQMAGTSST